MDAMDIETMDVSVATKVMVRFLLPGCGATEETYDLLSVGDVQAMSANSKYPQVRVTKQCVLMSASEARLFDEKRNAVAKEAQANPISLTE